LSQIAQVTLETRHFFSGAALYANGKICGLFSPTGLALKVPEKLRQSLIADNKGGEFHFFANGPVKREYVLISESIIADEQALQALILTCVNYVTTPHQ
jgi:TfoX/Sxy family transcriptional regulator of competence genes